MHDPVIGDDQERGRDRIGQERGVGQQRSSGEPQPAHRKARERPDKHGQHHRQEPDKDAVAELIPEIFEVAGLLRDDIDKAVERRLGCPEIPGELDFPFLGIERDQEQIVDRQQRPDQQHRAERDRAGFDEPLPMAQTKRKASGRAAHSCTELVWNRRISTMMSGIKTGNADITAATPSAGRPKLKA